MARKRRGRRKPRNLNPHHLKAKYWQSRLKAAEDEPSRKAYEEQAEETLHYLGPKHERLYSHPDVVQKFMDFRGAARLSVPRAAQVKNGIGPHLYMRNPVRNVSSRTNNGVMIGLARALEAYLNYTPGETHLATEIRRGVDDSLQRGRGFAHVYFDETYGVVTNGFVSSMDVLIDPHVTIIEDASWIAVRKRRPLWELKRLVKSGWGGSSGAWRLKHLTVTHSPDGEESKAGGTGDNRLGAQASEPPPDTTMIETWRIYSKEGSGSRGYTPLDGGDPVDDGDDFVCLEISHDCQVPLYEGEWEVPLYMDKAWPVEALDLTETLGRLWPVSFLAQVLSLTKADDLLASMALTAARTRSRVLVVGDKSLDAQVQRRIRMGEQCEYLPVTLKPGQDVRTRITTVPLGSTPTEIQYLQAWVERQFEMTTGANQFVHGASNTSAQDRSATASRLRGESTGARLGDLRGRVEDWQSRAARNEALYVRTKLSLEEVQDFVPPEAIDMFFVAVSLPGGVNLPVLPLPVVDEEDDEEIETLLSVQEISQQAGTYFLSIEEALQAMLNFVDDLESSGDPRVIEILRTLGPADEHGIPQGVSVQAVTIEEVWRDTSGMSAAELARELAYTIAAGSMPPLDPGQEQSVLETLMNQFMPTAMELQQYDTVNAMIERWEKSLGVPPDERLPPLQPPPAPMPAEEGATA